MPRKKKHAKQSKLHDIVLSIVTQVIATLVFPHVID